MLVHLFFSISPHNKSFMKASIIPITLSAFASILLLQSYSGGPAANGARATGAPGDGSTTCVSCHGSGAFGTVSIDFTFVDANGNEQTEYVPDSTYDITVSVNHSMGNPAGFGFQMICLDADDNNYDGWENPSGNAQLSTLSSRNYVEHDGMSTTNEFTVEWTAPSENTGDVTFYIGGNAVNNANGSGGDGADTDKFEIKEKDGGQGGPNGLSEMVNNGFRLFPNPATGIINVEGLQISTSASILATDGTLIRKISARSTQVDISDLPKGWYILQSSERTSQRFIKQ